MLHPSLHGDAAIASVRARWQHAPNLRVAPLLSEPIAEAIWHELRAQPYTLDAAPTARFGRQYGAYAFRPETACDHALCRLGRWLAGDGAAWVSRITGLSLGPPPDGVVLATRYGKGSFLDAHNDYDGKRQVAYVLGFTRDAWPAEHGGQLEFIDVDSGRVTVRERRAPGWNSLDLFDVRAPTQLHRVPIITRHVERRAVTGWFY